MDEKMEISPEGLLKRFSHHQNFNYYKDKLSTPQLSDSLKKLLDYNPIIPCVKPLNDDYKILGKIITVQTSSEDWGTVLEAIDLAEKGDIIFISADNDDSAVWGELTSKSAHNKGIAGTVIYGAVRDAAAIKKINYPVFSRAVVPNAGTPLAQGDVNIPLKCGEITINPQDVVLGDDCGVVVVPGELFYQAINQALLIREEEEKIIKKMDKGYSLSNIIRS